jgi:2-oxoglutarate ferredoxin oxidoreductase subunit alpha
MTSTSGPGWGLMQEMMSHISMCELPVVVVNVQRGGPGQGTTRHSQTDYTTSTRGGGNGSYRSIVLAPASVQECYDLMQLGFYLADKYNILTIVLADGIVIQIAEPLEMRTIEFPPLPVKEWALKGSAKKGGKFHSVLSTRGLRPPGFVPVLKDIYDKYDRISKSEVRYETYQIDDADLILVAFGYVSRCCEGAIEMARAEGLKLGLIRPVTLWPFPTDIIGKKASEGCPFLVVEDNMGQMIDDVKLSVEGRSRVHFLGLQSRHQPIELGMIFPETILGEVKKIL